jgi:alpha-1,3-mannosyltransferase
VIEQSNELISQEPVMSDHYRELNQTLLNETALYVDAILDPKSSSLPLLECPAVTSLGNGDSRTSINHTRYEWLQLYHSNTEGTIQPRYLFALNLHQNAPLLPALLGSILEAVRFLGLQNCALSIVEGRSTDGTYEILFSLKERLEQMQLQFFFQTSDIDTNKDRIVSLAKLRNQALIPYMASPETFSEKSTIIFINDIVPCAEDILEILHQRQYQGADMSCAMDWTYLSDTPTFYDVWISRGMSGDLFFDIPASGSWDNASNLLWNDTVSRQRFERHEPFQVFSCWNGLTAFTAEPILQQRIRFRANSDKECFQGEPSLFCKDMWFNGFGKIMVVPSVNVEYSVENTKRLKELKGFAADLVKTENEVARILWEEKPPDQVKCMPNYDRQSWPQWDEGLPL